MEALTAIGLIANIVQFVDLGAKLIGSAKEIHDSTSGMTMENKSLEEVTIEMRDLTWRLKLPITDSNSQDQQALRRLAQECRELSEQILHLLKKIAPGKPNSTLGTLRSAIKNIKYNDEKKELEERLAHCRSQLHLQFSKLTSSEVQAQLEALTTLAHSSHAMLEVIPQQIKQLRQSICVASLSVEAQDQIKTLLGLTKLTIEGDASRAILKSLAFDEMHTRAETIQEEHCDTFRWIVDPWARVHDTTLASNARELYISWLSKGRGIFHVAGKLGSGKSTLMKFLFDHPETRKRLLEWAGDAELVMTNHFFWKPGKQPLQKSFNGMMRSLLFDILSAHPALIKIAFPRDWALITEEDRLIAFQSLMPLRKTLDALIALLKNKAVQESYRFCFFIDALDEFEDTAQHDDSYLVDALRFWVQTSPNIIKLCVSSREHNVFVNAFADGPRIRLQELTRHDMECFTRSKLGSIPEAATLERLTQDIVNRSDGIFLWVVLVIKELRRALEDGRDTSSFKEELATLPTELEELFEHLLGSIQKSQRKKAYQIFAMVQKAETLPGGLSLLSCLYLDEYQAGGQFATKEPPVLTQLDTQNEFDPHTWYKTQTQKARRLLQACCRGLVEDRPTPEVINEKSVLWEGGTKHREKYEEDEKDRARREKYGGVALRPKSSWYTRPETYPNPSKPAGSRYVVFVHRTIVEFLERPAVVETTAEQLVGFDVIEAISQMHLAEYEATPCSLIEPLYWSYLYGNLMELRFRAGKDRSHFEFLVELESTVSRKFPGWLENKLPPSKEYILRVVHQGFAAGLVAQPTSCYSDSEDWKNHVTVPITTPVSYSAFFGNASYILWRITRPHKPPLSDQLVGIVLHCLSQSLLKVEKTEDLEKIVSCFERLLNESASPVTHYLWPRFLMNCSRINRYSEPSWSRTIGQLIVLFLERDEAKGVHTTEILIESKLISEDSPRKPVAMWVNIQDDHVLMTKLLAPPKEGSAGHILGQNNKGYVSLGELVKLWNLENEAEILGLIAQARTAYPHMTSQSLQRIDSAIAIWRQEHPLSSYSSIITIANIPPTRLRAAKARSGRAIGITTVITLLGLSAFLIAHQDYWVRQSSIIVYEPARIATEAYHHVNLGKD